MKIAAIYARVSIARKQQQETWEAAQEQLRLNKERAPRNNKKHDYLLKGLLICGHCQLRMLGHAGNPKTRKRRYLCSRKETLHTGSEPCPNRTVLAETIEELVWQSVARSAIAAGIMAIAAGVKLRHTGTTGATTNRT